MAGWLAVVVRGPLGVPTIPIWSVTHAAILEVTNLKDLRINLTCINVFIVHSLFLFNRNRV